MMKIDVESSSQGDVIMIIYHVNVQVSRFRRSIVKSKINLIAKLQDSYDNQQ